MIKKRIIEFIEFKKVKKENFFSEMGVTSANFRGKASETPVNSDIIANIFAIFPDLNLEWLITGEGEMQKKTLSEEPEDKVSLKKYEEKVEECVRLKMENEALKEAASRYAEKKGAFSTTTSPVDA